jgi:hypothetical protein
MSESAEALASLDTQTLEPPKTRMRDAQTVQDYFRRLIDNDGQRSLKRSRVNGLVDGNPPYKQSMLVAAGRAEACNTNWGFGRSYCETGTGAFYDLFSEAPGCIKAKTNYAEDDSDEKREIYSGIISEEADRILTRDKTWDYNIQLSIWDMVLHGCGPFIFEDSFQVLPKVIHCGDLKVPEFTKSDTSQWDSFGAQAFYYPPQLFEYIQNEEAATKMGWDVEYTRKVIANAMNIQRQQGAVYDWEFYQQELKNNSLAYYDDQKISWLAHVFWKEFDGRISHGIVERDSTAGTSGVKFLFLKIGRYKDFSECIHPMYFDHGNGGYHHSVTGLGVKMFAAMEYENRLFCNLADKAFAPKILFKPTTAESRQKFELAVYGDFATLPANYSVEQTGVAGLMQDGLAMHLATQQVIGSNLAAYRPGAVTAKSGNPVTKFEKQVETAFQAALSKTQFNRFYKQLDMLYTEIMRRLCNLNSTDERAKEFQKRCIERGVPAEALGRLDSVQAVRVVGQGSAVIRQQALASILEMTGGALPEDGRANLLDDIISSQAGQSAVSRYNPKKNAKKLPSDQEADATQWVAAMKVGVTPKATSTQNPVIHAAIYLQAAQGAVATLQKGGDPMQVFQFLSIIGAAVAAQVKRFANDPSRKALVKQFEAQLKQLAKMTDMLKSKLMEQQKQKNQQQAKTQTAMTDAQLKVAKLKSDVQLKNAKTAQQLKQSDEKHRLKMAQGVQDMSLADASTAHELSLNRIRAFKE